jgi:hypothetical protein
MARTHELLRTPLFFQFIQIQKGTPAIHKAIQSQEIDEPYRQAAPTVIRIPFWPTVHFYKTMLGDYYILSLTVTFRKALAVGFWRKTGYEEHEALAHAKADIIRRYMDKERLSAEEIGDTVDNG